MRRFLIVAGSLAVLVTLGVLVLTWWANAMSDAPGVHLSYWPVALWGFGAAAVLFVITASRVP